MSDCSTEDNENHEPKSEASSQGNDMLQGELECWFVERLCSAGFDRASAEALACCMNVMLDCSDDPLEERITTMCELLRHEGIAETVLLELASKISDEH